MKLETRNAIFSKLENNYALIRDEDGEVLCLLGRDNDGYFVYYMEHYNLAKMEAQALLDKSAGVAFIPYIDEQIKSQYQEALEEGAEKIEKKLKHLGDE